MVKDHIRACGRLVAKAEFEVDKDSARSDCAPELKATSK
jgi:hypothetical protein